jgi:murein DD-endopeptidase MepM/ murein hydrolase activator NlpD
MSWTQTLPPELRSWHPCVVSRRGLSALVSLAALILLLQPSAAEAAGPAAQLRSMQRQLARITEDIRVGTAVWMVLVRELRAEREHSSAFPGWLAVKASLHHEYRLVKTVLARTDRVVLRVLGRRPDPIDAARWRRIWPLHLAPGGAVRACPVQGPLSLTDSFGAPRPGGRIHEGNDLFGARRTPVVAVQRGLVVRHPNGLGGRAVVLRTAEGYFYYAHLAAYGAVGEVAAGTTIGFLGDSGDAKGGMTHVHFEYHPNGGPAVDPFPFLQPVC